MTEAREKDVPVRQRYIRPVDVDNRATLLQRIGWRIESFLWDWIYWYPLKAMPIETASNVGAAVLRRLGPLTGTHRTMLRNLRMAFPDWAEEQVRKTADGAWETLGRISGEMPHLAKLQPYEDGGRVEVVGLEHINAIRDSGRPAVLISGHMGNWEVMSAAISKRLKSQITYRALNNPHIDRRIAEGRYSAGIDALTPKGAGTRELMRALSRGESVGLMNDQKFNQGIAVPFFGHDAMTAPGPTRLAMRFNAPLLPVSTLRIGVARYRVTFHEPFMPETGPEEDAAIATTVQRINQFMEARIREAPDQWFWMHHRWPKEAWVKAEVM